jgi:hypothetical protein
MGVAAQLVIDDLENFHILTTDMKEKIIQAARNKVNIEAAMTRKKALEIIQGNFTIRNTFTARQVQYTQMPEGRYALSKIQSTVGVNEKASYMARQETGGKHTPRRGSRLAIPTDVARGGNKGAPVLRKIQYGKLKTRTVRFGNFITGGSYKSHIAELAAIANRAHKFISMNHRLFQVNDFEKRGGHVSFRLQQLYGFDRRATVTRAAPWLKPATDIVAPQGERIFISQMKKLGL